MMSEKREFTEGREKVSFVDLFAGAGGISEGFLQAYTDTKYYDFLLASDINSNCELTHRVRYNHQLGLGTKFVCQDIMDDSFLDNLTKQLNGKTIDVVTGGPSCQSFSLAGSRKKFDKRDNLFFHYLKVIKRLRPKYFVMENVKGILTKEDGKFADRIMKEIRSIIDESQIPFLLAFLKQRLSQFVSPFVAKVFLTKVEMETAEEKGAEEKYEEFFEMLEEQLKCITQGVEYKVSKSDEDINTVRHGILLLKERKEREGITKLIVNLKTKCNVNNDHLMDGLNNSVSGLEDEYLVDRITESLLVIDKLTTEHKAVEEMSYALRLFAMTFDECIAEMEKMLKDDEDIKALEELVGNTRLYKIEKPIVVLASNYGVPQNRERVLFVGCRKDQELITEIPATISEQEKVSLYEAMWDLDILSNGEESKEYKEIVPKEELKHLLRKRTVGGEVDADGFKYSEWSKAGRLGHRFVFEQEPFYVRNEKELDDENSHITMELFNHQTSLQKDEVRRRLQIIAEYKDYDKAKEKLKEVGLDSDKRNYVVLNPETQSPTVCTMPDDFIHYASYRPLTVREMARLQSFDDSFVFQGKRQTGGNKRKEEIPQYTLVGNAVPPLMARAIGNVILNKIR